MPRVPVTVLMLLFVASAVLLAASATLAQTKNRPLVYIIRKATQLTDDRRVKAFEEPYGVLSSARVIYHNCAADLAITKEQQDYLEQKVATITQDYMNAFEAAYVTRVGTPSTDEVSKDYVKYITDAQKKAMAGTVSVIQNATSRCRDSRIVKIFTYVEKMRLTEATIQAAPVADTGVTVPTPPVPSISTSETPAAPAAPN